MFLLGPWDKNQPRAYDYKNVKWSAKLMSAFQILLNVNI